MNNFSTGLKKFFSNKNTVTVIGILLAIVILYIGYNWRVNQAINPITVPYATTTITAGTQITEDMIGTMEVPPSMLEGDVIRDRADVVDMYVSIDGVIPEGSLFYSRSFVTKEQLRNSIIMDYPDGYVLYNLDVDMASTYSNSIVPGNYIDIYLKVMNRVDTTQGTAITDRIMVGKLLANVKVLGVFDSDGNDVFANLDENRAPAQIIFAVPEEYHILLRKASYLRAYESEIIPVPTAEGLKEDPGDVTLSSEDLKNFINNVTAMTEEDINANQ